MKPMAVILGLLGMLAAGRADTLNLQSGGHVDGVVLKEESGKVTVHLKHGIATLNREDITSIVQDEPVLKDRRIAAWTSCFRRLATLAWGSDLRPAAALVIVGGPFRNVPYTCDRSGYREFNIYGDPEHPAGLEFGLSKYLAKDADARKEAIAVLKSLLLQAKDGEALASIDPKVKSGKEVDGLVIETDEAQNAAGDPAWFVSVYVTKALDDARVADKDVPRATPVAADNSGKPGAGSATVAAPGTSTPAPATSPTNPASPSSGNFGFSPSAQSGEMPKTSKPRSYSDGGVNWDLYWKMHHPAPKPPPPPPPPPAPPPPPDKPKPKTPPK
jgi:hypothetical protein